MDSRGNDALCKRSEMTRVVTEERGNESNSNGTELIRREALWKRIAARCTDMEANRDERQLSCTVKLRIGKEGQC